MAIYLQIPKITGDSTAIGFTGQFQIGTLQWGGGSVEIEGAKRTFKTTFNSLSVSKFATVNTPSLTLLMVNRKNVGTVVITLTKVVDNKLLPAQVYTLDNARIIGFSQSTNGERPSEDISFSFSKITYQQNYYNSAGEKTGDETHFWDIAGQMGG